MIVVIADDLTGAAEIGGIGLRYNLTVEVITDLDTSFSTSSDILVIDTNTRSMSVSEAEQTIKKVCEKLKNQKIDFIFKKVDSVLRGHIATEIEVQLKCFNKTKALLVPANPSLNRTITNNIYYVNGKPINETDFANDPEFPRNYAKADELLGGTNLAVCVKAHHQKIDTDGIIIGEVQDVDDMQHWAKSVDDSILLAGSSAFFSVLLAQTYTDLAANRMGHVMMDSPVMYVCGSKFKDSVSLVKEIAAKGGPVCYMPSELLAVNADKVALLENWKKEILKSLQQKNRVIIAIDSQNIKGEEANPKLIRQLMAKVVGDVLEDFKIEELILEGGATASEILTTLNVKRLAVAQEVIPGLTRSISYDKKIIITLKPGSYPWSSNIWKL